MGGFLSLEQVRERLHLSDVVPVRLDVDLSSFLDVAAARAFAAEVRRQRRQEARVA